MYVDSESGQDRVEAARAGQYGKGFAVVAAEVRKLAERSKLAADDIIGQSQKMVQLNEKSINELDAIIPEIIKMSEFVADITASGNEQSAGAISVTAAINELSNVTNQNASSSDVLATSAEQMKSIAEEMKSEVSYFKIR